MIQLTIGVAVLLGAYLFVFRGRNGASGRSASTERGREEIQRGAAERGYTPGRDPLIESAAAGGVGGAAVGSLILPGIGTVIGAAIGFMIAGIIEAINHDSYGRIVRSTLADWIRSHGEEGSAGQVDAMIFRNTLLASRWVWRNEETGALAVEITENRHVDDDRLVIRDRVTTSLTNAARTEAADDRCFIPGPAHAHGAQMIERRTHGQLDGPNQRREQREWAARVRVGELYQITFPVAQRSWRTERFLFFSARWPLLSRTRTNKTSDWVKEIVTAENVDIIAMAFDRAAGVGRYK